MKKISTTIMINDFIREKLREQARRIGMTVSDYIAYLVMWKDEKDKQDRRDRQIVGSGRMGLATGAGEAVPLECGRLLVITTRKCGRTKRGDKKNAKTMAGIC